MLLYIAIREGVFYVSNKLYDLKKKLYFMKLKLLLTKAINDGKITEFEEEIFTKMSNTFISCLPVSFYIKYADYLIGKGTCFDRSFYMFLALDDAILVRGSSKALEYKYGKEYDGHGWIEIGAFVYDPSLMLKFDKDTYYSLYECSNIEKTDKNTFLKQHKDFVDAHVSYDCDVLKPGGKKRFDLLPMVIQIRALCQLIGDEQFTKDFDDYLSFIEYNAEQIEEEQQIEIQRLLKDKSAMSIISGNKSHK